ncbi:MAG: hypothetical protein Q8K64_01730 [Sediminibacterium sp.]|nr:hypothetical protein [Sediminibacterium sp.]
MKINILNFSFFLILGNYAQAQNEIKPCQKEPAFIRTLGFDPLWTALSTSEKQKTGIVLIEFEQLSNQIAPTATSPKKTVYQHESWKQAGYLSSIAFDFYGNAYTLPTPLISMMYNPIKKLNTIYQIDAYTGVLKEWLSLPFAALPTPNNPYGLLGITYDCTSDLLIASTVAGSSRQRELGVIYLIQASTKKITDTLNRKDVIGMTVAFDEANQKRLYFGKARTGALFSIPINANGKFVRKQMRFELSLDGYGPRGDDKVRKIKMTNSSLLISGVAFNFNLQASSEKPETNYSFRFNRVSKKWELYDFN